MCRHRPTVIKTSVLSCRRGTGRGGGGGGGGIERVSRPTQVHRRHLRDGRRRMHRQHTTLPERRELRRLQLGPDRPGCGLQLHLRGRLRRHDLRIGLRRVRLGALRNRGAVRQRRRVLLVCVRGPAVSERPSAFPLPAPCYRKT